MRLEGRGPNRSLMILSAKRSFIRRKSGEARPPRRAFARQKTGSADDPRPRRRGNLIEPAMSACGHETDMPTAFGECPFLGASAHGRAQWAPWMQHTIVFFDEREVVAAGPGQHEVRASALSPELRPLC